MATTVARLQAVLSANTRDFDRAMDRSHSKMGKIGKVAGLAGVAIAGGLAVGLEKSVRAAMRAQVADARLAVTFKTAGLNAALYRKRIQQLEASGRKLGFTDAQTKDALGSLIVATHSMTKASKDLSTAQDIARFKHVDLAQASKMLTMAMAGSQRAAKQLGISVPTVSAAYAALGKKATDAQKAQAKFIDKQATGEAVIAAVSQKLHGQADAYSKTASGGMEEFRAQLDHIEVAIGEKLLPVLTRAIRYVVDHWPQISAAIEQGWAAIKPTLEAFEQLIVSLVGTIRRHWSTIGPIVMDVAKVVRAGLQVLTDIIKVFAAVLRGDWGAAWNSLKAVVRDVFGAIRGYLNLEKDVRVAVMKGLGSALLNGLRAGLSGIGNIVTNHIINPFVNAIENGAKAVKEAVTGLFGKVINWAKSALGISSPSAVFHDIGRNVVKGFINGVGSMAGDLKHAVVHIAESAVKHLNPFAGGHSYPPAHGGGTAGENKRFALTQLSKFGWGNDQFSALNALWTQESGWSQYAKNKSSGAYGIAQALPPTKMPFAAQEGGGSSPVAQILWGLRYIKGRYGSPNAAEAHEQAYNWYDKGGMLPPGLSMALNTTGHAERVVSGNGDSVSFDVHIGREHLVTIVWDELRRKAKVFENRNGRPAFG